MIAIIDHGAGNLRSVANAIARLGYRPEVTGNHDEILSAAAVILPGVGAAPDIMQSLERKGLDEVVRRLIAEDRPLFAVCVGMQVLFDTTEEGGSYPCLGIVPGTVRKLPRGMKIPHMGWNQLKQCKPHPVFDSILDESDFYFVHSYYAEPGDESLVAGTTDYGVPIWSALARGNLFATQFHPEKSGENGLKMYANFLNMARVAK